MRNLSLLIVVSALMLVNIHCVKNTVCSPKSTSSEAAAIQAYAASSNITATPHTSGLYYEVITPGSGPAATANSTIFITYVGQFLDGTTFDQQSNSASTGWRLGELIEGWRVGLPLIQEGGHIKLIVPSAMAYGCAGYGSIPGNSVLFFDIHLVDVQ